MNRGGRNSQRHFGRRFAELVQERRRKLRRYLGEFRSQHRQSHARILKRLRQLQALDEGERTSSPVADEAALQLIEYFELLRDLDDTLDLLGKFKGHGCGGPRRALKELVIQRRGVLAKAVRTRLRGVLPKKAAAESAPRPPADLLLWRNQVLRQRRLRRQMQEGVRTIVAGRANGETVRVLVRTSRRCRESLEWVAEVFSVPWPGDPTLLEEFIHQLRRVDRWRLLGLLLDELEPVRENPEAKGWRRLRDRYEALRNRDVRQLRKQLRDDGDEWLRRSLTLPAEPPVAES